MEFQDVFKSPEGQLGKTNLIEHEINIQNAQPIKQPQRKVPNSVRKVNEKEIDKMLDDNIIRQSDSPWSSTICLVLKKDGTRHDSYPLPEIGQPLESLGGSKFFSTLDLASGYWQIQVAESYKPQTAFATHNGLYEFNFVPFGLTNAPTTFQRLMELI
ncbi:hypothetical protein SNE40_006359 [Patella caerulea]|uniref:Reverse transcriptase domain-containing protein n=1 Tax=Patella caerulea TaxID=87958 RepID=A0AAN8K3J5_PATCE